MTPSPTQETERLAALRSYDILDTPPEEAFDRITRLTAALTGVPIVLISLVDAHRQWFKSALGLSARESPRENSFCSTAILQEDGLVIEDAQADPRFAGNPLVVGPPHVRFYAGAPLRVLSGHRIGTLCLIDRKPRRLDPAHRALLADLAATVVDALDLRLAAHRSRAETERLLAVQHALKASEARNRAILDAAADAIITIDDHGLIESANSACLTLFGYPADELIGQNVRVLMAEPDRSAHDGYLARYRATGETRTPRCGRDILCRGKDGTLRPGHLAVSKVQLDGRTLFTGIIRDLTEEQRVQAELRRTSGLMQAVIEDSIDPIFIKDLDGRYILANDACARAMGHTQDQIIGSTDRDLLPAEAVPLLRAVDNRVIATGETLTVEETLPTPAGIKIFLSTKSPLTDDHGASTGVIGIARDITARKRAEEALTLAKEEADLANQAKSDFLSAMSHELRTPLNAVLGFSQMLEMNPAEPLSAAQQRCVGHIHRAGQHLLDLINEVLDLARIESGRLKLTIEDIDVRPILLESVALMLPLAEPRDIAIRIEPPAEPGNRRVRADATRLTQVLVNLLSNAIKYNRPGGAVSVLENLTPDGRLRLTVIDTGYGMAPEWVAQLFQPFNRLGAESSEIEGTGIGLAITRQLVALMGGTIGVSSRAGQGSVFWIELPLAAPAPETDRPAPLTRPKASINL